MKKFFGRKKDKTANADAPSTNPYAASPAGEDPYTNGAPPSNPPPYQSVSGDSFRREKSPAVTGPGGSYGSGYGSGYGGSSGGAPGGYGRSQPFGAPQDNGSAQASRRPGGYGGLGRANSDDTMSTDAGRDMLFSNAPKRTQPSQPPPANGVNRVNDGYAPQVTDDRVRNELFGSGYQKKAQYQPNGATGAGGVSGRAGDYDSGGYGGHPEKEMTAEEIEDQEVQAAKQELSFLRSDGLQRLGNAKRAMYGAVESADNVDRNMDAQYEVLNNVEANLEKSYTEGKQAAQQTRRLDRYNKTMWSVVGNGSASKQEANDRQRVADRQEERAELDRMNRETAANKLATLQNRQGFSANGQGKKTVHQFEVLGEESDDEFEKERRIHEDLDELLAGTRHLKARAIGFGIKADIHNKKVEKITEKSDKVDDQLIYNRAKLDRIK